MCNVSYTQTDEIAASEFAVDGQIEHGQITDRMYILKIEPNCPNVLWFEWWFLAN